VLLQDWPGHQIFFRDGKFVISKTWKGAIRTTILVSVMEALFLALVARQLETPWNVIAMSSG
jgi:hypothetical protein